MCGLCGVVHFDRRPVQSTWLQRMNEVLAHRGPDDRGAWVRGHVGLGHRRLAIRDLSPQGRQPMSDQDERVFVVFNGEIYNDKALREELTREHGVRFRTTCDTEVLPYAYLAWEGDMFSRLEGMFAIAIWDAEREILILARDRIGIKPLVYTHTAGSVWFGSEPKSLLAHPEVPREIDSARLHTFLASGQTGPDGTYIEGMRQVPPGSFVSFDAEGRKRERRYWSPSRKSEIRVMGDAIAEFDGLFERVAADHLVSDVAVGILQSGGIDSSLVSYYAGRHSDLQLFTVGFEEKSHDETALAGVMARHLGMRFQAVSAMRGDMEEELGRVVHHFDGQIADTGALAHFGISRAARREVKVVLTGDGADEFFGGYETYRASLLAKAGAGIVPRAVWNAVARFAYGRTAGSEDRLSGYEALSRFAAGLGAGDGDPHVQWRRLVPRRFLAELYGPALMDQIEISPYADYQRLIEEAPAESYLERCLLADQQFHLQSILGKVDAMSMAHGLEVRVPFLDRRVMEFAGRCAPDLLFRLWNRPKRILREAARVAGFPQAIITGAKKGFNVPISQLLHTALRTLADRYFRERVGVVEPYLNPDAVRALWDQHRSGTANHAYTLWPILTFAIWRAMMAEGASPGTASVPK